MATIPPREILPQVSKQVVTYGVDESANVRAENVVAEDGCMKFDCVRTNGSVTRFPVTLNLPGMHNVLNALAAIAVATEVGVSDEAIIKALAEFKGVGRRFQRYGEVALPAGGTFTLVDDYGHHPAEMCATIAASARCVPGPTPDARLPAHRYTRTRADCFDDFVSSSRLGRRTGSAEVYAAGEAPIVAADGRARPACCAWPAASIHEQIADVPQTILEVARDGDVVITMGAGSIGGVPGKLAQG